VDNVFTDDATTWIDPAGRDLSQRIWGNKAGLRAHIERMITDAIARGLTVEDVTTHLVQYVSPDHARAGEGKARYAAQRLANHEMRRASSIATRDTAVTNPTGGYLRYTLGAGHSEPDECTDHASHDEGLGRGVWPAKDCPLPPRHIGCRCSVTEVGVDARGMNAFVDRLRVEYGLEDPPDMAPDELAMFRRETAQIRQDVQVMFRAWFGQTGLVSRESLIEASPTVRDWVESVQREKRRRR
jgi:hypothetical protein